MKYYIYCDESGESSFSEKSTVDHFSFCALTVPDTLNNKIKNTLNRKKAKLYKVGWSKEIEIKASKLHRLKYNRKLSKKLNINGDDFIMEVLLSLKRSCSPQIDYIVVKKDAIKDEKFRHSPYGVAYNYFSSRILLPIILDLKDCRLTLDRRNKEIHVSKHFDGYLETLVRGEALEKNISVDLEILHAESRSNFGLQAVDFFSWSIFRYYEYGDDRFLKIFKDLVKNKKNWYCK